MLHIIVNPKAGRGHTMDYIPLINNFLTKNNITYKIYVTTKILDGYDITKNICTSNCSGIVGIGGDGTFQEIVAGLVDSFPRGEKIPCPLGIFAAGSGNDFIMSLEGSKKKALERYKHPPEIIVENFFEAIFKGKTRTIDVITANKMAYLNIGNIGLDAKIVRNAADLKRKFGRHAYTAAVYKTIVSHKNLPLTIEADGIKMDKQFTLVAMCNGMYYGGGLHLTPSARIDDGKITLCLVESMSRPKTMVLFPSLMIGKHTKLKPVSFLDCEEVTITLPPGEETLCLDGNLYKTQGKIEFKILKNILDVFI